MSVIANPKMQPKSLIHGLSEPLSFFKVKVSSFTLMNVGIHFVSIFLIENNVMFAVFGVYFLTLLILFILPVYYLFCLSKNKSSQCLIVTK